MKIFNKAKDFIYWEIFNRLKGNNQDVVCAVIINQDKIFVSANNKAVLIDINTIPVQNRVTNGVIIIDARSNNTAITIM